MNMTIELNDQTAVAISVCAICACVVTYFFCKYKHNVSIHMCSNTSFAIMVSVVVIAVAFIATWCVRGAEETDRIAFQSGLEEVQISPYFSSTRFAKPVVK
jgi:Na+/H+-translocating membrane pyrophosphatase